MSLSCHVIGTNFITIFSVFGVFPERPVIAFHFPEPPPFPSGQSKQESAIFLISTFVMLADSALFLMLGHFTLYV